jgi:hypothetical protein
MHVGGLTSNDDTAVNTDTTPTTLVTRSTAATTDAGGMVNGNAYCTLTASAASAVNGSSSRVPLCTSRHSTLYTAASASTGSGHCREIAVLFTRSMAKPGDGSSGPVASRTKAELSAYEARFTVDVATATM